MKEFCEPVVYTVRGTNFYVTGEEVENDIYPREYSYYLLKLVIFINILL